MAGALDQKLLQKFPSPPNDTNLSLVILKILNIVQMSEYINNLVLFTLDTYLDSAR